jgi:nitrate reductase delta subunit
MFGTFKRNPAQLAAFEQIEGWTRARFALAEADAVLVTEITCRLPGCPPLETVIAFWKGVSAETGQPTRHHYKVFKKAVEVVEDDLPPTWYRPALVVDDNASMDCGC